MAALTSLGHVLQSARLAIMRKHWLRCVRTQDRMCAASSAEWLGRKEGAETRGP